MASNPRNEETKDKIEEWLLREGFKVSDETNPKMKFNILATDNDGRKINILQPLDRVETVVIVTAVALIQDQRNKIRLMDAERRARFLWDLRFGLLNAGVVFDGITESPERIFISTPVYYDGLTHQAFMDKVSMIRRMLLWVIWTVDRELGERSPSTQRTIYG